MDVVYIRSYPGRPQEIEISPTVTHRAWVVSISTNDYEHQPTTIIDPFTEIQYKTVFERYLRNTDRPPWGHRNLARDTGASSQESHLSSDPGPDVDISHIEDLIQAYSDTLLSQLIIKPELLTKGATDIQLYIVEHYHTDAAVLSSEPGIHCLAWELLETIQIARLPQLRIRITRVADFPLHARQPARLAVPLSTVQGDTNATFRVLLVIARDFNRADRDPDPDLGQWPLMNVQKRLRSRMMLEVVRPGSFEELADHLRERSMQGVQFHLVHFDLHGRVKRDEAGNDVPWLLFAKRHYASEAYGYHVPQTRLAKASDVAELLAEHQVENVVLNACLSAYNRTNSASNLSHLFLRRGIQNVSAMWFYVHWQTAATYLDTFYDQLFLKGVEFHAAAQRGREAVRGTPTIRDGRPTHDSFLCVNYARYAHRTETFIMREPSPTPSVMSLDSSNSNLSGKRNGVRKSSTPRLADSLMLGDEPVIRLKLHLLELEYKLMTFRIVYATDLRRPNSDLSWTIDRMVNMWLNTNLIDEVYYYRAKDFARKRFLSSSLPYREKKTRASNGGFLQLLFSKPVKPLKQTLHIIKGVDSVIDPGRLYDEAENIRNEERRVQVEDGLDRFAKKVHADDTSFVIFVGRQDAEWWRKHLQRLYGAWWLHMQWNYDFNKRLAQDGLRPSSISRENSEMD